MAAARCRAAIFARMAMTCLALAAGALPLLACATVPPPEAPTGNEAVEEPDPLFDQEEREVAEFQAAEPVADPLEEGNRAIFRFNQKLDDWFWSPLTRAYRFITPEFARVGIRRALRNLNTPVYVANHLLQLRLRDAGQALGSFALNSTLGIFGFLEPSKEAGWEVRPADFGQTLGLVGVGNGPYMVIPVFGPTTVRDGFGNAVDYFLQPLNYVLGVPTQLLWGGGSGLSLREGVADQLAALEKSSVDFYSVMRSAYQQNRDQELIEARSRRNADLALVIPDSWLCRKQTPGAAQE
jgi:phospholipid-binding lipoprotein MlaA